MSAGGLDTAGSPPFTDQESARYRAAGWWSDVTLSDAVRHNAGQRPDHRAYVDYPGAPLTWREFDYAATSLAEQLIGVGVVRGDRVAVWHGDSAAIHVLFVAIERCGAVVVGIGARAGTREVTAILHNARPKMLISDRQRSDAAIQTVAGIAEFAMLTHDDGSPRLNIRAQAKALSAGRQLAKSHRGNADSGRTPRHIIGG